MAELEEPSGGDGDHQHYVPQFVLRNFAAGTKKKKKAQVHVFDKHSGVSSLERIWDVAAQPGFYDLPAPASLSADPALTNLENRLAPIITKVVKENHIGQLSAEDRVALAVFCAAQMMRVPMWREQLRTMNQLVRDSVGAASADRMGLRELTDDDLRAHGVWWLRRLPEFMPHFLDKQWVLFQARAPHSLYISDNPITLDNNSSPRPAFYGNLGLAVPGIEIYLPLSSRLVLAMFCPSIREKGRATLAKAPPKERIPANLQKAVDRIIEFENAFTTGRPLTLSSANVERLNSLQVQMSARFVYSAEANFDLVRTMLQDHPDLSQSLRIQGG